MMVHRLLRICVLVLCGLLAADGAVVLGIAVSTRHAATQWPDSGYRFWPERSWRSYEQRLTSISASPVVERSVIATVTYGRDSLPIHVLHFRTPREKAGLRVLLVSGMHGTETAGVEALLRYAARLAGGRGGGRTAWRPGPAADITIIPVTNPWAWIYGYRYDGEGEDVNRDFASARTQEAAALRRYMREHGPWDLFMDLHESKKAGYFIYQYLPESQGLGADYVRILKTLGRPVENAYREGPFRVHQGLLTMPASTLPWIAMAGRLSFEQYARLSGTEHAYTVETPVADDEEQRIAVHIRTVEAFIERLLADAVASRPGSQ